jgi:hypothetical protein
VFLRNRDLSGHVNCGSSGSVADSGIFDFINQDVAIRAISARRWFSSFIGIYYNVNRSNTYNVYKRKSGGF